MSKPGNWQQKKEWLATAFNANVKVEIWESSEECLKACGLEAGSSDQAFHGYLEGNPVLCSNGSIELPIDSLSYKNSEDSIVALFDRAVNLPENLHLIVNAEKIRIDPETLQVVPY